MRQLILLRHGKTESVSASGGDFTRRLTERGRRDSALMGKVLAEAGLAPDLVLVSAALRTMETWSEAAPSFPGAHMEPMQRLYHASADDLAAVLAAQGEQVGAIMVIGHNPGLHEYAASLMRGADRRTRDGQRLAESFPTAAAAVFLQGADGASLQRLYLPRDFGGGA
jgi:phosphohistidine phosphatase